MFIVGAALGSVLTILAFWATMSLVDHKICHRSVLEKCWQLEEE